MSILNLNNQTLPDIANSIKIKTEDDNTMLPAEMPERINSIRSRTIKTGVIKLNADSQTLTIPTTGKLINVRGFNVPLAAGYLVTATWSEGVSPSEYWGYAQIGAQMRYTNNTNSVTFSGLTTSVSNGETTFNTSNTSRLFAADALYVWTCFDWEDEHSEAVYDVGTTENTVYIVIIGNADGGTYSAYVIGEGAIADYGRYDTKPWADYIDNITNIYVGAGITSIGAYCFAEHTAVKRLQFEDSTTITHLGDRAFWRCQFSGNFSFPNLTDTALTRAFAACGNMRELSLPNTVTTLNNDALNACLNLRKVTGLENVQTVGKNAFFATPKLTQIDLDQNTVTSIGNDAFFISPAFSNINVSEWSNTTFGTNAAATINWTEEQLSEVRAIELPNIQLLSVDPDILTNYGESAGEDFKFSLDHDGTTQRYLEMGCDVTGLCLLYNLWHGTSLNLGQWWTEVILPADDALSAVNGQTPIRGGQVAHADITNRVAEAMGTRRKSVYPLFANITVADNTVDYPADTMTGQIFNLPVVKQAIVNELLLGNIPVLSWGRSDNYQHAVNIIGANAATDKLIVVDNSKLSSSIKGNIYEIALEDIISNHQNAHIDAYEPIA